MLTPNITLLFFVFLVIAMTGAGAAVLHPHLARPSQRMLPHAVQDSPDMASE